MPLQPASLSQPGHNETRWLHDLRTAAGTAAMASSVLRRLVETGVTDRSADVLHELETACTRVRSLLDARPRHDA